MSDRHGTRRHLHLVPPIEAVESSPTAPGRVADKPGPPPDAAVEYAELHCHTHFSFLDGTDPADELVAEAARLGLTGVAVTDHDGLYSAVQMARAGDEYGVPIVYGAELSLGLPGPQNGVPDPVGRHLVVLARGVDGYRRLSAALTEAHLAGGEKGRPVYDLDALAAAAGGYWQVLTGCRKGTVPAALAEGGADAAAAELNRLADLFGAGNVAVELIDHDQPTDDDHNAALAKLAADVGMEVVATNNVHYARPSGHRLATAVAAVRSRRSLDEHEGWLPAAGTAHLRSGAEMAARFRGYPQALRAAARIAAECAFDLDTVAPRLPPFPTPDGGSEMAYLRELAYRGAARRYGPRDGAAAAYRQLDRELALIDELGFAGYFLIVWDIVQFCEREDILCQGRGSAANSVVCFVLGITHADPIRYHLLFERFLSKERDSAPDIDVDFEAGDQREKVIQYVYARYGRRNAALVANVITYRPRMAVRDAAKALGHSPGQQDAWSKQIDGWSAEGPIGDGVEGLPRQVARLAEHLAGNPRHLGIHPGGMVLTDQPVSTVVPVEYARMADRTVLQWDKDDCERAGLVKFDLLGLGMLAALHKAFDAVAEHWGTRLALHDIPADDPAVYDMLCAADTVGTFQVESRAQIATLPRLKPRTFFDLAVEIALIRPGPVQGGAVHPYLRRRAGREAPDPPHPLLADELAATLGVPLFQEQMMRIATICAGFTPGQADELRRAMGSKRSRARMRALRERLYTGMARRGITGPVADQLYRALEGFAEFGFPQSHAISFAFIALASAHVKRYYPAAFYAALLASQPMGFYSPSTLVDDARRHGVPVVRADINHSDVHASVQPEPGTRPAPASIDAPATDWGVGGPPVRLGLAPIRGIGRDNAERIVTARREYGPFTSLSDLARRTGLSVAQLEMLATAGACASLGLSRRQALWAAGAAAADRADNLPNTTPTAPPPTLPGMSDLDLTRADLHATGVSIDRHPVSFLRPVLDEKGVTRIADLADIPHGTRVRVAGAVTARQRPGTARGVTFLNLEDETGLLNIIVVPAVWNRHARVARTSPALIVRGMLEKRDDTTNLLAEHLQATPPLPAPTRSRDFR